MSVTEFHVLFNVAHAGGGLGEGPVVVSAAETAKVVPSYVGVESLRVIGPYQHAKIVTVVAETGKLAAQYCRYGLGLDVTGVYPVTEAGSLVVGVPAIKSSEYKIESPN